MIRRRLLLLLGATIVLLTATGVAVAFWTTSGVGTGSGVTGTLDPPTDVAATTTPGIGTAAVSWTASAQATGYYVTRVRTSDNSAAAACGTSLAQPTTGTSCDDLAVADGIYHYTVTAVLASWTGTSASSEDVTVNNTRPAVTVNQAAGQADPTKTAPINFTAVFDAVVTDFTSSDVTVTPGTATAVVTGGGTTYTIAVSGMTSSGTVSASIAANAAHDAAGAGEHRLHQHRQHRHLRRHRAGCPGTGCQCCRQLRHQPTLRQQRGSNPHQRRNRHPLQHRLSQLLLLPRLHRPLHQRDLDLHRDIHSPSNQLPGSHLRAASSRRPVPSRRSSHRHSRKHQRPQPGHRHHRRHHPANRHPSHRERTLLMTTFRTPRRLRRGSVLAMALLLGTVGLINAAPAFAANANSGDGTMAVSPTSVVAGSTGNQFTFVFTAPAAANSATVRR